MATLGPCKSCRKQYSWTARDSFAGLSFSWSRDEQSKFRQDTEVTFGILVYHSSLYLFHNHCVISRQNGYIICKWSTDIISDQNTSTNIISEQILSTDIISKQSTSIHILSQQRIDIICKPDDDIICKHSAYVFFTKKLNADTKR